ncbi:hypothetical protein AAG570_010343 [Ranatra chinensis]|uniref:RNA-directed DNA polymerase n=1 Tax=Ranatra chinensis TaxID=642074 RepID=A0ABD0Z4D9_9HEMI
MEVLVDTGSTTSLLSGKARRKNFGKVPGTPGGGIIRTVSGRARTGECVTVDATPLCGRPLLWSARVMNGEWSNRFDAILGVDFMAQAGVDITIKGDRAQVRIGEKRFVTDLVLGRAQSGHAEEVSDDIMGRIRDEFRDVIQDDLEGLKVCPWAKHYIPLVESGPVYKKPYRYPHAMREEIRGQLDEMLKAGIIRHSASPFSSPLWVVPKGDPGEGKQRYRVVVDYRDLNRKTEPEFYPLPRIEDVLDMLAGATIFSVVDLKSGYHQIEVAEKDKYKTAFTFERGHYEYNRMPFGLRNAPATFQRLMDAALKPLGIGFVQGYMDDLIIFSKSRTEHLRHLRAVFRRLREAGLTASASKSKFALESIDFLGYVISREGVAPARKKVQGILDAGVPQNQTEIRRVLGMINYYRRFIPNAAEVCKPLTAALQKGGNVKNVKGFKEALEQVTDILCRLPTLRYPDFKLPFEVCTDASDVALGAVLSQQAKDGEYPLAFISRTLSKAECNYSTVEKELLAIVWAVEQLRPYLYGNTFTLFSDHKPLVWMESMAERSPKIARWKEALRNYDFVIKYREGKANVVADYLSRPILIHCHDSDSEDPWGFEPLAESGVNTIPDRPAEQGTENQPETVDRADRQTYRGPQVSTEIVNKQKHQLWWQTGTDSVVHTRYDVWEGKRIINIQVPKDASINTLTDILTQHLVPDTTTHMYVPDQDLAARIWTAYEGNFNHRQAGLVQCGKAVESVRTTQEQGDLVKSYHLGKTNHRGINETLSRLSRHFYWPGMKKTIEDTIGRCEVCNRAKYLRQPTQVPQEITPTPQRPFERVHIDLFYEGRITYMTGIDPFSKYAMALQVPDKSGNSIRRALANWFAMFGIPMELVMDNGNEFRNELVQGYLKANDVGVHFTTPGHHQSNGPVERFHSTLIEHLRLLREDRGLVGPEAVLVAVAAYNSSIHSVTGVTPFEAVFGQTSLRPIRHRTADAMDARERNRVFAEIEERVEAEKAARVTRINESMTHDAMANVRPGDVLYKAANLTRRKGDRRFDGPFLVRNILDHGRLQIENVRRPGRTEVIHLRDCRVARGLEDTGAPEDANVILL